MFFDLNINTDNPLKLNNNVVFIEGSLIVDTNKLPLIGLQSMCYANDSYKQYANRIIHDNLLINDKNVIEYSSFTTFITQGDIIYYKEGDSNLPFPIGEINVYKEKLDEFNILLKKVDDNSPQLLLQSLYVSVFSRYEYAIMLEVLFFLKYKLKSIISFFKKEKSILNRLINNELPDGEKESKIMSFIRENIYAGNIRFTKDLLQTILDKQIEIPTSLKDGYIKRNSIVHRAGCNSDGIPIEVKKKDIETISKDTEGFINYLINSRYSLEMQWVDSARAEQDHQT